MRKLVAFLSAVLFALSVFCFPIEAQATSVKSLSDYDMVQYFSLEANGTIHFDSNAAAHDGIDNRVIDAVSDRIDYMNQFVVSGQGYVDDEFAVVLYITQPRSTTAVGENTVKMLWDGTSQLLMDSVIADNLYYQLLSISETLASVVNNAALEESGVNPVHIAAFGVSIYFMAYAAQVGQAKAPGRGIILNYKYDALYYTESYWFTSQ